MGIRVKGGKEKREVERAPKSLPAGQPKVDAAPPRYTPPSGPPGMERQVTRPPSRHDGTMRRGAGRRPTGRGR